MLQENRGLALEYGIQNGTYGTLQDYERRFSGAPRNMGHIMSIMSTISEHCSSAIFLGGHTARPELLGHRKARRASVDLDMLLLHSEDLERLVSLAHKRNHPIFLHESGICFFVEINGTPVSFNIGKLYGLTVPEDELLLAKGEIRIFSKNLLSRCKIRRALEGKGKLRPKDIIDIGNMALDEEYPPLDGSLIPDRFKDEIISCINFNHSERKRLESFTRG